MTAQISQKTKKQLGGGIIPTHGLTVSPSISIPQSTAPTLREHAHRFDSLFPPGRSCPTGLKSTKEGMEQLNSEFTQENLSNIIRNLFVSNNPKSTDGVIRNIAEAISVKITGTSPSAASLQQKNSNF